jgi:tetratricopeptide (TPR) repeat protein
MSFLRILGMLYLLMFCAFQAGCVSSSEYHVSEARRLMRAHDDVGAEQQLRKAIELEPNNASLHSALGFVLDQQRSIVGKHEEALQHLKSAIQLEPRNAMYYEGLGASYLREDPQKLDQAAELFVRCLQLDPGYELCKKDLAYVQRMKREGQTKNEAIARREERIPELSSLAGQETGKSTREVAQKDPSKQKEKDDPQRAEREAYEATLQRAKNENRPELLKKYFEGKGPMPYADDARREYGELVRQGDDKQFAKSLEQARAHNDPQLLKKYGKGAPNKELAESAWTEYKKLAKTVNTKPFGAMNVLKIYSKPDVLSEVVKEESAGMAYVFQKKEVDFYYIEYAFDKYGYIHKGFVE